MLFHEMLLSIWTLGRRLWWSLPSPKSLLSVGASDNNTNLALNICVSLWGEKEVDGIIVIFRCLYCTQNNSAPQDNRGNNVTHHCACNYTGEVMSSDLLVSHSPLKLPLHAAHTQKISPVGTSSLHWVSFQRGLCKNFWKTSTSDFYVTATQAVLNGGLLFWTVFWGLH